jgi:hypothetical protein
MGFLTLQPPCQGDCEVDLVWRGRGDYGLTAAISLGAMVLLAAMFYRRRRWSKAL